MVGSMNCVCFLLYFLLSSFQNIDGLIQNGENYQNRRRMINQIVSISSSTLVAPNAFAIGDKTLTINNNSNSNNSNGLANKLAKRDASMLKNSVFNIPPSAQSYPLFMGGEWKVESKFRGFIFPSTSISKEKITSNPLIPGFQKCSIAALCDVGKESFTYTMRIDSNTLLEDRNYNLSQMMNANLGYKAVEQIIYDPKSNPNRISIDFVKNRTRNAERIELFCNARESQLITIGSTGNMDEKEEEEHQQQQKEEKENNLFVCSEYIRQVTFSYSQEFGVARQVNGNYAHFWTWKQQGSNQLKGNLLTAAYLDPQDPLFLDEPVKPVVVYSQDLIANRLPLS